MRCYFRLIVRRDEETPDLVLSASPHTGACCLYRSHSSNQNECDHVQWGYLFERTGLLPMLRLFPRWMDSRRAAEVGLAALMGAENQPAEVAGEFRMLQIRRVMKSRVFFSMCRLAIASAVLIAAVLPNKMSAVSCSSQQYGNQTCTQCYVYSPLGWVPVGNPKWVSTL
jgi:hypothetical protein